MNISRIQLTYFDSTYTTLRSITSAHRYTTKDVEFTSTKTKQIPITLSLVFESTR